ncbi:DUF4114 domain-containing protein [Aquabacter cavernae]|uniref:DUF4114 domain-containing protein n=1 Tax=Aquabacter cavernae TaxID=2496029 RepID=UPI000F8F3DEB|nr:DUF4114 domain-containing protein [Aquabacter cavernae]
MAVLANSTFLDHTSYNTTTATTVQEAYDIPSSMISVGGTTQVAITLGRANDPTDLLNMSWADRQKAIAQYNDDGTLWSTFGADQTEFNTIRAQIEAMGIPVIGDAAGSFGFVTSAESRTIWVSVDSAQFQALFGTPLMTAGPTPEQQLVYWNGSLSVPDAWNVEGLWVLAGAIPAVQNLAGDVSVTLPEGAQSIGNSTTLPWPETVLSPAQVQEMYNFPVPAGSISTGTIALIEPDIGDRMPADATRTFQQALDAYRTSLGITTPADFYTVGPMGPYDSDAAVERSMDVGIIAAGAPNSRIGIYAGEGTFISFQLAIWDLINNPDIIASSFAEVVKSAAGSPFHAAYEQLMIDAVLRNMTVYNALGDGGSGDELANGLPNIDPNISSSYVIQVGGTSASTANVIPSDATLADVVTDIEAGDLGVIWRLVAGGLMDVDAEGNDLVIETVWNQYRVTGLVGPDYAVNQAGSGGVDISRPTPWYQTAFGLTPTTDGPDPQTGRGAPDVSAVSGGNLSFLVPNADMTGYAPGGGTSASSPFWATVSAQLNAIFQDQGLPQLGYYNDLLYQVAAITPGAFNDVTYGSIFSTYYEGGPYSTFDRDGDPITITPTGYGYETGPGYDLATGLGSPNLTLLARSLTTIGHTQWTDLDTNLLEGDSSAGWTSATNQSLLFQPIFSSDLDWSLSIGGGSVSFSGVQSGAYAWSNQFAQQSLQADFSADLVTMFDSYGHGSVYQSNVAMDVAVGITLGEGGTYQPQSTFTNPFGFMDFVNGTQDSAVQVARAVALAATAGGADDQDVVVRMRQNGVNDISVLFYAVDDAAGTVNGIAPGEAGYEAASTGRAYVSSDGEIWIDGAGYGAYSQTMITGVDMGDLVAMKITNGTNTFYAFAQANEQVNGQSVGHLWNYGLNTWGWEDLYGGGDLDYNDLVVQLDFTSASGSGWLV